MCCFSRTAGAEKRDEEIRISFGNSQDKAVSVALNICSLFKR